MSLLRDCYCEGIDPLHTMNNAKGPEAALVPKNMVSMRSFAFHDLHR